MQKIWYPSKKFSAPSNSFPPLYQALKMTAHLYKMHSSRWLLRHPHFLFLPLTITIWTMVDLVKSNFFSTNVKFVVKGISFLGANLILLGAILRASLHVKRPCWAQACSYGVAWGGNCHPWAQEASFLPPLGTLLQVFIVPLSL